MGLFLFFLNKLRFFSGFFLFLKSLFFSNKSINVFIFLLLFQSFPSFALKIRFPDEELATESVLPIVDSPNMVLNRNVSLRLRAELGVGVGFGLGEPFYFPFYGTGLLAFHFTETHAISVTGTYFPPLRSAAGNTLSEGEGLMGGKTFDPLKAPYPQMMAFVNYQYTPYYGKISLAKNWVMNLSVYGFIGPGLLIFNHNNQTPVGNLGIGQKFYFNKWLGIRGDLGAYGYYGPAIAKLNLDEAEIPYSQITAPQKRLIINIIANFGVILLI